MSALSRKYANRKSLLRNLATSLVLYEQIKTTKAKAKETKAILEHLISIAKKNDLSSRRILLGYFFDKNATKKVYDILLPRYKNIQSGYIKSYKLGNRLGDNAEMVLLKLTPAKEQVKEELKGDDAKTDQGKAERKPKAGEKSKAGTSVSKAKTNK